MTVHGKATISPPLRRPLKIFATDPMVGSEPARRVTIDVPNETTGFSKLQPGPCGLRVAVIDYDATRDRFYRPVDLDDPAVLMQGGLEPSESDPRFHQQMVYAVAMKTIENFESSLGRTINLNKRGQKLRLFPHGFRGQNAFYNRDLHAVLFGYFRADQNDPGEQLPGQYVFTCLSHDIIVHELTHAVVDRLRRYFLEPSNEDVLAFHEGFSDIVALFQHFTFQELLRTEIERSRGNLTSNALLVDLARQFGYASGSGRALRSALDKPDRTLYKTVLEPHQRGGILVAAVFDAFFAVYQGRIQDLIRIATGGTGRLPEGDLHPDLVNRIATEASKTAQYVLNMCIRAFEYLPPVDITFGDYLRALVTADFELWPSDQYRQRACMIEAFRRRGLFPENVASLAEESLIWTPASPLLPKIPVGDTSDLRRSSWSFGRARTGADLFESDVSGGRSVGGAEEVTVRKALAMDLQRYAQRNARALGLDPDRTISVHGFHWVFRVGRQGQLLMELVAMFTQRDDSMLEEMGGIPLRGGCTIIAASDGSVRYVIAKPLPGAHGRAKEGNARRDRQLAYVESCDAADPCSAWCSDADHSARMTRRMNLSALHQGAM